MIAANGASRALFGNNDNGLFDVKNRLQQQQRIDNNGFLSTAGSDNKKDLLSVSCGGGNKNIFGGGWGVKEDRIRFLLQAAEAAQRRPTPPHPPPPPPSTSIAQSLFLHQQQNSALNQYVNALSACLPSGMHPVLWPPAMSLPPGGGGGTSGSLGGSSQMNGVGGILAAGARFPTDMGPHAKLLSSMSLGGGEDLSATSSMLSSMLAKLSGASMQSARPCDERRISRPDSRDSLAASALMMLPQDLSTTGMRVDESNARYLRNHCAMPGER